jgi:ubiquinone/menaquinone biosynthesis C-methylase UbiE
MEKEYSWKYDEAVQTGTDYESIEEVEKYDERMSRLRDVKEEIDEIFKEIKLSPGQNLVEIGCGTGEFAIAASEICSTVTAVDVSEVMLKFAARKADERGCKNINFVKAGFLDYDHQGEADAVVSQIALHHLPDFWKLIALKRIYDMLKMGGRFFLRDLVFSVPLEKYEQKINGLLKFTGENAGEENAENFARHINQEFSTYDWIMEEMLYRAGFYIESADYGESFIATYVCVKTAPLKFD